MSALTFMLGIALVSWLMAFPARKILTSCGVIDRPNARSSHSTPVVRGGGIAILAALSLGIVLEGGKGFPMIVLLAMLGLGAISFTDDLRPIGPAIRFGCHLIAAFAALSAIGYSHMTLSLAPDGGVTLPVMVSWILAVVWVCGYTNAFNFMDGINGISGGQAVVTGAGMALLGGLASGNFKSVPSICCLAVAGSCLGFLPHNFPKARMFMGDVGSASLGFILAVLVLWMSSVAGWWLVVPLTLLHANYILDTGITLVRRALKGERWYEPHREHFYQRIIRAGKSHAFVTSLEMVIQIVVLGLMVLYLHANVMMRLGLIGLVIVLWLAFFGYCELSFRRIDAPTPSKKEQRPAVRELT